VTFHQARFVLTDEVFFAKPPANRLKTSQLTNKAKIL
jgi:hypothetical protein